jgi:hypothetical protein
MNSLTTDPIVVLVWIVAVAIAFALSRRPAAA